MRNVLAIGLGLLLAGALALHGVAPASAGSSNTSAILASIDGGITPSITLAGQGLVVPPSIDDVDFMCALLLGCSDVPLSTGVTDHGDCVKGVWKSLSEPNAIKWSLTMRECGLQSNSCSELRTCATRGAATNVCDGRGMGKPIGFCDADGRAVQCKDGKLTQVRDCPRVGEQCAAREGTSTCTLGACPSEVPADGTAVCSKNGQKVFSCDKSKLVSFDCTAFGLTCITTGGAPACASEKTASCTNTDKCDGDTHVGCVSGHEVKVQCDKAGMKCSSTAGANTVGSCEATNLTGAACDGTFKSQCVGGNSVEYCAAGHKRTYFCKGSGFAKCTGGAGAAHCSN